MNDGVDRWRVFCFVNLWFDSIGTWWMDTSFSNKSLSFLCVEEVENVSGFNLADQSLICLGTQVHCFFFLVNFGLVLVWFLSFCCFWFIQSIFFYLSHVVIVLLAPQIWDMIGQMKSYVWGLNLSSIAIGGPGTIRLNSGLSSQKPFYW